MSILDIFIKRAEDNASKPAYIFLEDGESVEEILTYGQLRIAAQNVGSQLGIRKERACILLFPSGLDFLKAFWGCLWGGKIAVPVSFPARKRGLGPLSKVIEDVGDTVVLTDRAAYDKMKRWFGSLPVFLQIDWLLIEELVANEGISPCVSSSGEEIAILQYTSGSTGNPKGVMVTHGNVMHNLGLIQTTFGLSEDTIGVTWLPHFHDMGLIDGFIEPVFSGFTCVFMSPLDFVQKPARWLWAISRYRAYYSGGPNFAYDLCVNRITDEQLEPIDLSHLEFIYNGAEAIHSSTLDNFASRFKDKGYAAKKMVTCYGMAETTLAICFSPRGEPAPEIALNKEFYLEGVIKQESDSNFIKVGSGIASEDVVLKIVDPLSLKELGERQIGEIWTQSESVSPGYWGKDLETEKTFFARIEDAEGSFLRTGDLGFLSKGALYITGRLKDLIIYHGINYFPEDLEESLSEVPELKGYHRAAFSVDNARVEGIVIVVEVGVAALKGMIIEDLVSKIKHIVFSESSLPISDVVVVSPRSLPKSTSGKIQRSQCKKLYLLGELKKIDIS